MFSISSPDLHYYVFHLYVAGLDDSKSIHAIQALNQFCVQYLQGGYQVEVIDIYQDLELAESERIMATPTLVKQSPLPVQRFVGDLSDVERLRFVLKVLPE